MLNVPHKIQCFYNIIYNFGVFVVCFLSVLETHCFAFFRLFTCAFSHIVFQHIANYCMLKVECDFEHMIANIVRSPLEMWDRPLSIVESVCATIRWNVLFTPTQSIVQLVRKFRSLVLMKYVYDKWRATYSLWTRISTHATHTSWRIMFHQ